MGKNERNFATVATEAWVVVCYVVGQHIIIDKVCEATSKRIRKIRYKHKAFELYRLVKNAMARGGYFLAADNKRFRKLLKSEVGFIESRQEQSIQVRMRLENLLKFLCLRFEKNEYYKVDEDMIMACKFYGDYKYDIMSGKILNINEVINTQGWAEAEDAYNEVKDDEVDKNNVTDEELRDYLKKLGASEEVIETILKSLDDCFGIN